MSEQDLRRILGLGLDDAGPVTDGGEGFAIGGEEGTEVAASAPSSPYALEHDSWTIRRGAELVSDDGTLCHLEGLSPEAAADFYGAAFVPDPVLVERCEDERRREYLANLIDTPEWRELNTHTAYESESSEFAAGHFADGWLQLLRESEKDRNRREARPGRPDPNAAEREKLRTARMAKQAARAAKEESDAIRETAESCGLGEGLSGGRADMARILDCHKKVRRNGTLRAIVEAAGRFRRAAQSRHRNRVAHGQDEVVGITQGNDLSRLLPNELARLASGDGDDVAFLDAARRVIEASAGQYESRATEPVGRGPVVVVVDESGSMSGEKIATAKGLALTIAWVAKQQRRWVALVGFAGGTEGNLLTLAPGRWDEEALLEWLSHFYSGGTTLDVPIRELPFTYWPKLIESGATRGKTDVILITDAIVHAPDDDVARFVGWKHAEDVKVRSLILKNGPGDLARISDSWHTVHSLDVASESVLSTMDV